MRSEVELSTVAPGGEVASQGFLPEVSQDARVPVGPAPAALEVAGSLTTGHAGLLRM